MSKSEKEKAVMKARSEMAEDLSRKNEELSQLRSAKELEIAELRNANTLMKSQSDLQKSAIKEEYETKLRLAQEQVDYYKDLKLKMSTKMVGETLEEHCKDSYETRLRPLLTSATFEKDNDASGGTKGDFIFRDFDNGLEYVSIMFEMKNEMDTTATKHKNEHFFKKLDADRKAKGCEYAVLVSLLESESELYNSGIVDVSHHYPKMYVIRPQFFIPLITLLVNSSKKSIEYKRELVEAKNQSVDVNKFQEKLEDFKRLFSTHYKHASDRFQDAIKGIDKTIKELEAIKTALVKSEDHLRLANKNAEDLNLKRLTADSPGLRAQLEEL